MGTQACPIYLDPEGASQGCPVAGCAASHPLTAPYYSPGVPCLLSLLSNSAVQKAIAKVREGE